LKVRWIRNIVVAKFEGKSASFNLSNDLLQDFLAKYQFLLQDADLMHCAEMRGASLQDVDYKLECAQEQEGDFMVSRLMPTRTLKSVPTPRCSPSCEEGMQ
jgi:hypothetical protein